MTTSIASRIRSLLLKHRAIVDTHRHPKGPRMQATMAERGLYDPKQEFPQTNAQHLICYRECFDLDYATPTQREGRPNDRL